eukprot:TRINITY_DN15356_c0_g1_i2.p1 TRINITY_DN15356_c0_g1~~TRINITY_DN15356_c0_g1_i2.p1  ORF type:complete len:298 (+),score=56.40 TRINITY_DN15356_c0_g1_i2:60-896(+)
MDLECTKLPDSMPFRYLIQDRGHDFWVSSMAGVSEEEMPGKIATLRVEDELVSEVFTHCYFKTSNKIKSDANAITDEFGLGLRKKRVTSQDVAGCVFVLINKNEETLLSKRRAALSPCDKKLSSEERLRRTQMQFYVTSVDAIMITAKAWKSSFWLTSFTEVGAEEAKKKIAVLNIEGKLAFERFAKCMIAEVPDCQRATETISKTCGLGLRKSAVRTFRNCEKKGSVALLFSEQACSEAAASAAPEKLSASPSDAVAKRLKFTPSPKLLEKLSNSSR